MKKIISLFMVVLMIFSLGACGTEESQNAGLPEDTENGSAKQKSQMEGYLRLNKGAMYWWYIFHGQIMLF